MTTICRHIKTNGERCGSPALRDHIFCYYHRSLAAHHPRLAPEAPTIIHPIGGGEPQIIPPQPTLNLPPLEDRESIQLATSMVIGALARNTLDTKRGAILLYGLQVASANARNLNHRPRLDYLVTETTLTTAGDEIAPDEEPLGELAYQELLQNLQVEEEDEDEGSDDLPADSTLEAA